MGMLVFVMQPNAFFASINLSLDYLNVAKEAETVRVEAEVVKKGRNIFSVEGRLYNQAGKLAVKASSNLFNSHLKAKPNN
jgi:acyl-coenzyme A thioesterase PaaI-like protein